MTTPVLRQSRVWVACLWAAMIGAGVGALHAAWNFTNRSLSRQAALLVPATAWNPQQRDRALADIRSRPEVREAGWISPGELARETGRLLPPDRWPEILSEEDAWLPWLLEVRWHSPLLRHADIRSRVESFRLDAQWKLVLWDDEVLMRRRSNWMSAMILGGGAIALVMALGLAALASGPSRESSFLAESLAAFFLSAVSIALMGAIALMEGFYLDPLTWGLALGTAFMVAGVIAPVIKRPKPAPVARASQPSEPVPDVAKGGDGGECDGVPLPPQPADSFPAPEEPPHASQ